MKICLNCRKIYGAEMQFCTEDGNVLVERNLCGTNTEKIYFNANFNELSETTIAVAPALLNLPEMPKRSKQNLHIGLLTFSAVVILLCGGLVWAGIHIVATRRTDERAAISNNTSAETEKPKRDANQNTGIDKKVSNETSRSDSKKPPAKRQTTKFNGRVIMLNAVLRRAPTMEADEEEILSLDEPVRIGQKASANSPWFRVVTASGATGWMHGNTIEFNR